jgi:sugar phosphate isomerase/epimerase
MKREKIGISIAVDTSNNHFERLETLLELGFKHIELYNKIIRVRSTDINDLKQIIESNKISFSFHSMVQDLFSEDEDFAKQEYYTLKGELKLAHLIGCKRVVFHIHHKRRLMKSEVEQLKEIVDFANKLKIEIAIENNPKGAISGSYLIELLEDVPHLKLCLDVGHLNIAVHKGEVENLNEFLSKIQNKVVQLHLSSNDGKSDQHHELNNSSLDYIRDILKIFENNEEIEYIIETKNIEQAKKSLKFLEYFLK